MILIERTDGGVSVMRIVGKADVSEAIRKWKDCHPGEYVSHSEGDAVPADRTFRAAWTMRGKKVGVDMTRALEVGREMIREGRKPRLAALDVDYQRADEQGDERAKKAVAAAKQKLRDATADERLTKASDPDALKAAVAGVIAEL